jgi:ketosteroid isomerase-like protein
MKESDPRDPLLIALLFNECINTGDLEGLTAWMTPEHVFIDARGGASRGSTVLWAAWRDYFRMYPDYRNHFSLLRSAGATVSILGCSTCSCEDLDGPALWSARIEAGKVAEWRVWLDTRGNRELLGLR